MSLTTDRADPGLQQIQPNGQQQSYLVLSDKERAKGFVRPVRYAYRHLACGSVTTMGQVLCETYARDPKFYSGTFCCHCSQHFPLGTPWAPAFVWEPDGDPVGSNAEEAVEWSRKKLMESVPERQRQREQRIKRAREELDTALGSPEWEVRTCCECCEEYPCDLQNEDDDPVYCPKCHLMQTVVSKTRQQQFRDDLDQISGVGALGRKCSKCGGPMAHYRLTGYRCLRGCP